MYGDSSLNLTQVFLISISHPHRFPCLSTIGANNTWSRAQRTSAHPLLTYCHPSSFVSPLLCPPPHDKTFRDRSLVSSQHSSKVQRLSATMKFLNHLSSPPPSTTKAPGASDLSPLHIHHLTPSQRAFLSQNPTYTTHLSSLTTLHTEVRRLRSALQAREIGKIPPSMNTHGWTHVEGPSSGLERDRFDALREECGVLERRLWQWDGQLAGLAEALLERPGFGVGEIVVWDPGSKAWWWRVPEG